MTGLASAGLAAAPLRLAKPLVPSGPRGCRTTMMRGPESSVESVRSRLTRRSGRWLGCDSPTLTTLQAAYFLVRWWCTTTNSTRSPTWRWAELPPFTSDMWKNSFLPSSASCDRNPNWPLMASTVAWTRARTAEMLTARSTPAPVTATWNWTTSPFCSRSCLSARLVMPNS
uniref:Uncharacterized protein n=1 Tax=Ixodes ricinus TaxID=34613 RepID=A0A6B0UXW3_IXORI